MKIHRAYRHELDPNVEGRILLTKRAGAARFAYTWGSPGGKRSTRTKAAANAMELHQLNHLKKTDFPWMDEVSKRGAAGGASGPGAGVQELLSRASNLAETSAIPTSAANTTGGTASRWTTAAARSAPSGWRRPAPPR
ncbi:MAG: helix-turn-helix domain-containing protein [Bacillota bacterium]|nr:helix-turn-helix domain-containing protein [Bacillota bacterium]